MDDENLNNVIDLSGIIAAINADQSNDSDSILMESAFPEAVNMPIDEILVAFPGHPSPAQREILESVISVLKREKNLLLECANDEERRLATTVAVLAVQNRTPAQRNRSQEEFAVVPTKVPALSQATSKVYVATKSNQEIEEVLNELKQLKNTGYLQELKLTVLFLPDDDDCCVCQSQDIDRTCQLPAPGYNGFKFIEENGTVHNIEELFEAARRDRFCPKLFCKQLLPSSNFVVCEQQVLTSAFHRKRNLIELNQNDVIIFDDGNGIEKACHEEASVTVSTFMISRAARDLWHASKQPRSSEELSQVLTSIFSLSTSLQGLSSRIDDARPQVQQALFEILIDEFPSLDQVDLFYSNLLKYLEYCESEAPENNLLRQLHNKTVTTTSKLLTAMKYYYIHNGTDGAEACPYFSLRLRIIPAFGNEREKINFNILCVKPSIVFEELCQVTRSIIIASPCVPSKSVLMEQLGLGTFMNPPVEIMEQNRTNVFFAYCGESPNNGKLEFDYKNKLRATVHREVGESVLTICEIIPGGVIIFFPSRGAIADRVKNWRDAENRENSVYSDLEEIKHIFNELDFDNVDDAKVQMEHFRRLCINPIGDRTGALMLALHRGNVYKTMNFHQEEVRAIVNCGIPFDYWGSIDLETRRNYFESLEPDLPEQARRPATRKFYDWYNSEAFQFVNETFSHCVRRGQNWISVIVLDQRMVQKEKYFDKLVPAWIRRSLTKYSNFNELDRCLENFVQQQNSND